MIKFFVTLIINFAIKLIKRLTTFQTKSPIAARSDWRLCHRKILNYLLKCDLKFFQQKIIRKSGIVGKGSDCDAQGRGFESRHSPIFKVSRLNERRNSSFFCKAHKSLNLHNLTKNFLLNFITQ